MSAIALLSLVAAAAAFPGAKPEQYDCHKQPFNRVWGISIDGLHSSDVEKWLAHSPNGNIAALLKTGYEYTNAYTSAPSDSFPGTCAFYTGATPKTTGVWYDDTYDRSLYAPKDTACKTAGAESE